ncbi:hypothetical protein SDRG_04135 [Saprolegnia diclina VS20]|uniref:Uncharacterized protein n=1 Tax=Saprolegnia diclina (strain VS20) TaxID=1156394 RepID=T0QUT7_SAPDV|nr:hypothetical protein SDRG_04135 [Saprolegnia diclina VS20]EQC38426.1 hypothetical protein SDRG_04135 [Saprolegnia diclina VS20]|eukprot:XP_008608018.1 hypothetical protein SDRG_04135 [Saprolegnia diclina VS20]
MSWIQLYHSRDPDKAVYEDAVKAVDDAFTYLRTSLVEECAAPLLRIDGIDGVVTWPLSLAHAAALAALDVANGKVPPTAFSFAQPKKWRQVVKRVLSREVAYAITDADLVLSHLVVDAVGSSAALVPNEMPPDSYGYMVLHLPSTYDGGDMTFAYGYITETWTPDKASVEMVTTFRDLIATSAPITNGVRMALVFRLVVQNEDEDGFPMPCDHEDGIRAFNQVAQLPLHTNHCIAYYDMDDPPTPLDTPWTFETLGTYEAGLVHALLTTELYDVALVTFELESGADVAFEKVLRRGGFGGSDYGYSEDEDDEDAYERKYKNQVATCTPHTACNVPPEVIAAVVGSSVDAILFDSTPIDHHTLECPPFALLFWLKRYRASILGLDDVLPLLQDAVTNDAMDQPLLGLPSGRDVLHGALGVFRSGHPGGHNLAKSALTTVCDILLALDDFELVLVFLRDAIFVCYDMPLFETAACIHACLSRYGWPQLAPAIHGLLSRWHQRTFEASSWVNCGTTPRLLASLAGITTTTVCPPLYQPFVCEFIKGCYDHALRQPQFLPDYDMNAADFRHFAANIVLLDWYFDELAPNSVCGNYLGAILPPNMLLAVDTFLYIRQPSTLTLLAVMKKLPPKKLLEYVPEALDAALKSQPTMSVDPYVHAIENALVTFDASSVQYEKAGAAIFASLVAVLERAGRCDVAAFQRCWTLLFPASLAGTRQRLQERTSPLPDDLRACISSLVVALAPTLLSENDWHPTYKDCYTSWELPGLFAVEVLAIVDPSQVPSLLHGWLDAVDREVPQLDADLEAIFIVGARDPARDLYYPLATLLAKVVPQHVDEIERVVQRCFAVFGPVRTRTPLPDITDYVFSDVPLDAEHCDLCAHLAAFLADGTKTTQCLLFTTTPCSRVQQCIDTNCCRLKLIPSRRSRDYVVKLKPQGGVDHTQLAKYVKAQQVDTDDRARLMALDVILADVQRRKLRYDATTTDEAVHHHHVKRQRQTTD